MDNSDMVGSKRTGEKIGWVGGWSGGFIWVLVLAVVRLVQGATVDGLLGLVISAAAFACICLVTPWKRPETPMWKLMLPLYAFLALAILWAVWTWGGFTHPDFHWWMFFWVLPCLTPFWVMGGKRWNDANKTNASEESQESQDEMEQ